MKTRYYLIVSFLLLLSIAPLYAYAACPPGANGFIPLACTDGSKLETAYSSADLSTYLNRLFEIALSVGAMAAVLRLVYAGYIYMGSSGMWGSKARAKEIMGDAILGLLLLLAAVLILYQINPQILNLRVNL